MYRYILPYYLYMYMFHIHTHYYNNLLDTHTDHPRYLLIIEIYINMYIYI